MVQDISKSIEACAAYYGKDAGAVRQYLTQGQERALALPNRGPLRFDQQGAIEQDILDAYSTYGFYIFEKALSQEEVKDLLRGEIVSRYYHQKGRIEAMLEDDSDVKKALASSRRGLQKCLPTGIRGIDNVDVLGLDRVCICASASLDCHRHPDSTHTT